jgi:glutamate dehydrogenase
MQVQSDLAAALEQLAGMARARHPDDDVLAEFLPRYYHELPEFDVDDRKLEDVLAVAASHLELGRVRAPGHTIVHVENPPDDSSLTGRSLLFVVADDVPFMVDSIRIALERHGLDVHLLVHPMLGVERDGAGRITSLSGPIVEAWTQIEIDRCDDDLARTIETEVQAVIGEVQRVVADYLAMRARLDSHKALDPLIGWLANDHFMFLGAADYQRTSEGLLVPVAGSELGQIDADGGTDPPPAATSDVLTIARTDNQSTIHRPERRVCISVRPPGGAVEHRFFGLLGARVYRTSVFDIPTVGGRARAVLELSEADPDSYLGRAVRTAIETLPRELVFELDENTLAELVIAIVGLQERQLVRVFDVPELVGPWRTVLVFLPRNRFTGSLPDGVADSVAAAYGGERGDLATMIGTSTLARISMAVRRPADVPLPDLELLAKKIDELSTSWIERLRGSLVSTLGEVEGQRLFDGVGRHVPPDYLGTVAAAHAIGDLQRIDWLLSGGESQPTDLTSALVRDEDAPAGEYRFRVYRRDAEIVLAELLPRLDHLGLIALDEHPYGFHTSSGDVFVYDIGVRVPADLELTEDSTAELHSAFAALMAGDVEADGFNRLVLSAGLTTRDVAVLRAYAKYLRQIGFAFSQQYIESTLANHPALVAQLVELFHVRFDPAGEERRAERSDEVRDTVLEALDAVPSLDDDRICRAFLHLIGATVRTNAWRGRTSISFKFDPTRIPDLPLPRPVHEIWVCSPDVEGVHLRGGAIARGGLRWSDRREDFRTEVLGLMKAQVVKNAVIVPVGAKGGFVVKRPPAERDQLREAGIACYQTFVRSMLDITDNIVGAEVVHPPDVVRHDGDDTYLVVAADKGTATFSDIANEISVEYGYWLGDAFASGGSAGYDHKAMGITARGAWESVRRHASTLGKNPDRDSLTAVGIGDMSGDVFGNGMLCSEHLALVAAFDHRDIFIDPSPEPFESFAERKRLFELPRSSWQDYDRRIISAGGSVYSRSEKSIVLSDEARKVLGAPSGALTPTQVISAILRAPVDLLWNGGIGTYVKASTETHAEVGDRANDAVRIDADELRCKMVGEGGNLGFTQLARVEYALNDGLIYTDAIDNSAGVDCSDHEVNIKILVNGIVADGGMTADQRNELLESMTAEVAEHVLDHNRAQTLALLIARRQSLPMVNVHARYLDTLEAEGWLDRGLEFLPSDKQIAERQSGGTGLVAPEFAVLIAYTKNADVTEILKSDVPDDPAFAGDLASYFPARLGDQFADGIAAHRLRREIITTQLVNEMVNLSGISFDHRMTEETGSGVAEVARAWVTARDVLDFARLWDEIEALESTVALDVRLDLFLDCRRMNERVALWILRHRHPPFDIATAVGDYRPGLDALASGLSTVISGRMARVVQSQEAARLAAGVPEALAERSSVWPLLHTGFDLVEVAKASDSTVLEAARIYWDVHDRLELMWLWDGVGSLPRANRWQSQARSSLRDDMLSALADLTSIVLRSADGSVDTWMEHNRRSVARVQSMFTEIRRSDSYDVTNLSVALRQLRNLALTSVYIHG